MSLENMNKWTFTPKKDYNANRLTAGLLQLSHGKKPVEVEVYMVIVA